MRKRNIAGGAALAAAIGTLLGRRAWDYGWELFRAKVGEATYSRIEHTMHGYPFRIEHGIALGLTVFSFWLLWPEIRKRGKQLFPKQKLMALQIGNGPFLDTQTRDERGSEINAPMLFPVQITNISGRALTECQVHFATKEQEHPVSGRFSLRPGETRNVPVIRTQDETLGTSLAFAFVTNDEGKVPTNQLAFVLAPNLYTIKVLCLEGEPTELPIKLLADDSSPPRVGFRNWRVTSA